MVWLKCFPWKKILVLTLVFVIVVFLAFPLHPAAEATNPFTELIYRVRILSNPPRGAAPKGRRTGGAGRGPICALIKNENNQDKPIPLNQSVTALVPLLTANDDGSVAEQETETTSSVGFVGGFTIEAQPTFWFYLPYIATPETSPNRVAQFILLDESDRPVWQELMSVELLHDPRLVEYPLPYSLETGKLYNWYFSVICDSDKRSKNPVVRGWVQRKEPTDALQTALRNASYFEQYAAYAENGIWFETVNSLVKIRRQFPSVNRDAWTALLASFKIPTNLPYLDAEPAAREVVNGNQFPARM